MPLAAEPAPVLDYAPTPLRRPLKERIAPFALILICTIVGGFILNRFQPYVYTSIGYLAVPPSSSKAAPSVHARALTAFAPSVLPKLLPTSGRHRTAADLTSNLKISVLPGSPVVLVAYTSDNPAQTASVVNALMNAYIAQASEIMIAAPAAIPTSPRRHSLLYPLAGAVAGAIVGVILLALKKRQDAHWRDTLNPDAITR